jgi:hypothetical protein
MRLVAFAGWVQQWARWAFNAKVAVHYLKQSNIAGIDV